MIMDQTVINIVIGIAGFLGASIMGAFWIMLRENQKDLSDLRIMVAGSFVRQEKFDRVVEAIFVELRGISYKLADKADRSS